MFELYLIINLLIDCIPWGYEETKNKKDIEIQCCQAYSSWLYVYLDFSSGWREDWKDSFYKVNVRRFIICFLRFLVLDQFLVDKWGCKDKRLCTIALDIWGDETHNIKKNDFFNDKCNPQPLPFWVHTR